MALAEVEPPSNWRGAAAAGLAEGGMLAWRGWLALDFFLKKVFFFLDFFLQPFEFLSQFFGISHWWEACRQARGGGRVGSWMLLRINASHPLGLSSHMTVKRAAGEKALHSSFPLGIFSSPNHDDRAE